MILSLLVAVARNRAIGLRGDLPWHLPRDLRRFKRLTTGHPIVMGRRTWESIGRPLPERRSVVLSRDPDFRAPGAEVMASLDAALALLRDEPEVFVIGGAGLFEEALPRADKLYLTRVHADVPADVFFPELDLDGWRLVSKEDHTPDRRNAYPISFEVYEATR